MLYIRRKMMSSSPYSYMKSSKEKDSDNRMISGTETGLNIPETPEQTVTVTYAKGKWHGAYAVKVIS
jgi:hypothetical protein